MIPKIGNNFNKKMNRVAKIALFNGLYIYLLTIKWEP